MEGETRATIGGGNVTVGDQNLDDHADFASLNRDVIESQVVTLDQQRYRGLDSQGHEDRRQGAAGGYRQRYRGTPP